MSKGRIVVAMSGGVDSSVAACLLNEQGYQVIGVTMRLWSLSDPSAPPGQRGCCSVEDVDDARRVCQVIGVPHYVMNFERQFQRHVVDYFVGEYRRGRTPHPCIACNDRIKFDFLMQRAGLLDADLVATGHYARVQRDDATGRLRLLKSVDHAKDQSYVLFGLSQRSLARLLLPVGEYTKAEVRGIAARAGLPVAGKPDSQEICFIPTGDYRQFLRERIIPREGVIVDTRGTVVGRHQGVEFYTVGQRRGLGIASREPLYVVKVEPHSGRVVVGTRDELLQGQLLASGVSYIAGEAPKAPLEVRAKVRYKAPEVAALLEPLPGHRAALHFHEPQRAITPGQAVVFYDGPEVLGGGVIEEAEACAAAV
ncbi:MAG: tRNA 2-thiouridine(34) synthase MnmA [Chloroflexi bacterium]|nr:tRNA 2-thiouridine(34) synthase MnmA [Chloroflexota bacterium]